jgi:hypothetical protein
MPELRYVGCRRRARQRVVGTRRIASSDHTKTTQVPRQRRLTDVDALLGEEGAQLVLAADTLFSEELADG